MAVLPTDYQDDVLASSMNGKRRYQLQLQDDGTYILNDVTIYDSVGSTFGAAAMNQICGAVNKNTNALSGLKFVLGSPPPSADSTTVYIELEE